MDQENQVLNDSHHDEKFKENLEGYIKKLGSVRSKDKPRAKLWTICRKSECGAETSNYWVPQPKNCCLWHLRAETAVSSCQSARFATGSDFEA